MKPFAVRGWAGIITLTGILIAVTIVQSLNRYEEFRSGYSWDLAYYNQWFWAITRGDGVLTVRPGAEYAFEGPSVWRMNHLSPIRLALLPIYAVFPDPRTLVVIQNVIFWCVVPAAYTLVRSESKSDRLALAGAALVPLTPVAWLLVWNDFRELQLGIPFVLWAIQGWRERRRGIATVGIAGLLACRQEFALLVMSLALLSPQEPETAAQRRTWTLAVVVIGAAWFLAFLVYLAWRADVHTPADYLTRFTAPQSTLTETLRSAFGFLLVGLSSWFIVAMFAPRVALLAVPWMWVLSSGRWDLQLVSTPYWHHVRYALPMTAVMLAAGLVGFARAGTFFPPTLRSRAVATLWSFVALGLITQTAVLQGQFARVPRPISRQEATHLWSYIREVGPTEGVFAAYDVSAPLSSRRWLYSYALEENRPPGYPRLVPEIGWGFIRKGDLPPELFLEQGFVELSSGPYIQVFRRGPRPTPVSRRTAH